MSEVQRLGALCKGELPPADLYVVPRCLSQGPGEQSERAFLPGELHRRVRMLAGAAHLPYQRPRVRDLELTLWAGRQCRAASEPLRPAAQQPHGERGVAVAPLEQSARPIHLK